jgi:hypothetical protein
LTEIICDQFGNYVIQKFVECCVDKTHVSNLFERIKPHLYLIATNCYGTRSLQKLLDHIPSPQEYNIIRDFFIGNISNLAKDVNGNHVIQKIIEIYPKESNQFIVTEIAKHIVEISKLKLGVCVYQKIIDRASDQDKVIHYIMFLGSTYNRDYQKHR